MSKSKCVLVVNDYGGYYTPFANFGRFESKPAILERHPDDVALVVFTGGEDVSPELYGEAKNDKTYCNRRRDDEEKAVFDLAVKLGKPIAGICRGSQLICALSGGKLVQHVTGHHREHTLMTDDGRRITVSSTHHQMQKPDNRAVPVAWAEPKLSNCYEGPNGVNYDMDLEHDVVYYPDTKALGMQYHPEYMSKKSDGFLYVGQLIQRFFKLEQQ